MQIMRISNTIGKYNNISKVPFKGIKDIKSDNDNAKKHSQIDPRPWATEILQEGHKQIVQNAEKEHELKNDYDKVLARPNSVPQIRYTIFTNGREFYEARQQAAIQAEPVLRERQDLAVETIRIASNLSKRIAAADAQKLLERETDHIQEKIQEDRNKVSTRSGISRVAGYEYEQDVLYSSFIDKVAAEKAGQDIDIPSSILFFGPYGNGKTYMTRAIADETRCQIVPIVLHSKKPEAKQKAMQKILDTAQEAEKRFQTDRTRTIIFIDELEKLTNNNPNGLEEFKDFVKSCSDKYHCSVFASTNHPLQLGLDINDPDIFPIRVSIDPPNNQNAAKMFEHYLNGIAEGEMDYNLLASELIGQGDSKDGKYNNQQIKNICYAVQEQTGGSVTQEDILDFIKVLDENPIINKEMMEKFQNEYETFIQDN